MGDDKKLLQDTFFMESVDYEYTPGKIVEHKGRQLHILGQVEGKMGHAGVPTGNGRLYSKSLMEGNLKRLQPLIEARGVYGEVDHPAEGKTKLQRVSHIITKAMLEAGGELKGSWDIIDTPNGRIQLAICKANGMLGASTRGTGSTTTMPDGTESVNDDYRMITIDAVVDPAAKDAYPALVQEAQDLRQFEEMVVTYELLKKEYPGLHEELVGMVLEEHQTGTQVQVPEDLESAVKAVREEFQTKLESQKEDLARVTEDALDRFRDDIANEEREKLLRTLEPVQDRSALEEVGRVLLRRGIGLTKEQRVHVEDMRLAMQEAQDEAAQAKAVVRKIQEQSETLASMSIKTTFALIAERRVGGKSYRDAVMNVLGDFSQYPTKEKFKEALDSACAEFESRAEETDDLKARATQEAIERERKEHRDAVSRLEKSLGEVEEAHAEEIEELKSRHEVEVSELKAEVEAWKDRHEQERKRVDSLGGKVEHYMSEAQRIEALASQDEDSWREARRDYEDRISDLEEELESSRLKVRVERMLAGRSDADRLRPMVERASTEEEAASIIANAVRSQDDGEGRALDSLTESVLGEDVKPRGRGVAAVQTESDGDDVPSGGHEFNEAMSSLGVDPSEVIQRIGK